MKKSENPEDEDDTDAILFLVGNRWQNSFEIVEQRKGFDRRSKGDQRGDRQQKEKQANNCKSPKLLVHDIRLTQSEAMSVIHLSSQQKVSIDVGDSPVFSLRLALSAWH